MHLNTRPKKSTYPNKVFLQGTNNIDEIGGKRRYVRIILQWSKIDFESMIYTNGDYYKHVSYLLWNTTIPCEYYLQYIIQMFPLFRHQVFGSTLHTYYCLLLFVSHFVNKFRIQMAYEKLNVLYRS